MNTEQWARVKTLFNAALETDPASRDAWRAQLAGEAPDVRREVEELLRSHDGAADFLDQPALVDPRDLAAAPEGETLPAAPAHEQLAVGTRIGDYEIRGEIGRGGMGVVYLARDVQLTRMAALKALPRVASRDRLLLERLRREAQAAAAVVHTNVATVYAFLETGEGTFIATEFIQGRTLRQELQRGALEPARAIRVALEIARALCAAHDAGVVHRDLKPENVLLSASGGVKVIDFGIARLDRHGVPTLTVTGMLQGTPGYMAPEQLVGGVVADARADLYALGVILGEMLIGSHPLERGAKTLPVDLQLIVRRCLESDPERRYASTRDLLDELERASRLRDTGSVPLVAAPAAPPPTAVWWWQFHQALTAVIYWVMAVPAWFAHSAIDQTYKGGGRVLFFIILGSLLLASILRLHLWFTSRTSPRDLAAQMRRERPWILAADGLFALSLIVSGVLVGERAMAFSVLLLAVGVGAWVISLFIEPSTARAAFPELEA